MPKFIIYDQVLVSVLKCNQNSIDGSGVHSKLVTGMLARHSKRTVHTMKIWLGHKTFIEI
jgi:hypothetical protein